MFIRFILFVVFWECLLRRSEGLQTPSQQKLIRNNRSPDKDSGLFGVLVQDGDSGLTNEGGRESRTGFTNLNKPLNYLDGFLPLPPKYNKLVIPLGNVSESMYIMVYLSIREILDVDTNNGMIELDTELGVQWIDWEIWQYNIQNKEARKKVESGPDPEIILNSEFLNTIWKPDIFIEQMASVERTSLLSKLITLKFLVKNDIIPGILSFQARQSLKVRCEFKFEYYPADTQTCPITIRSYSYPQKQMFLLWNTRQKVFLDQLEDSNYNFQVANVEPGEKLYDLFTTSQATCCNHQNYSTLTFDLKIRRNLMYHVIQTWLPSILLILITWLCFLLPPDMVEVRIGISMTTLLTLTAMFTAVREQSPAVSYAKAIDYWMVFCILLLFIALVLFTTIYWIRRKLARAQEAQKVNGQCNLEINEPQSLEEDLPTTEESKFFKKMVEHLRYAFIFFAIIFIVFLITFSLWIFFSSDYFNWDPSAKYNAVPIDDGKNNSNRLFDTQMTEFKPTAKKKVVGSVFRFKDLVKNVIFTKLRQISEEEEGGEYEEESEEVLETTTIGLGSNQTIG